MRIFFLFIYVLLSFSTSFLPVNAQENIQETVINTQNNVVTDSDIAQRIEQIFREFSGLNNISVIVNSGVVTLRGEVAEAVLSEKASTLHSVLKVL